MKAVLLGIATVVLMGTASYAAPARVMPAEGTSLISEAQYRVKRVMRPHVCRVETIRTRTPRGVIVRKIRRCR
jgi:hypothetical protein